MNCGELVQEETPVNQRSVPGVTEGKKNPGVLQMSIFCINTHIALRKYREGLLEIKTPTFNSSAAAARL